MTMIIKCIDYYIDCKIQKRQNDYLFLNKWKWIHLYLRESNLDRVYSWMLELIDSYNEIPKALPHEFGIQIHYLLLKNSLFKLRYLLLHLDLRIRSYLTTDLFPN